MCPIQMDSVAPLEPKRTERSVVVVGSFAPETFEPSWFRRSELASDDDVRSVKLQALTSEVTSLTIRDVQLLLQRERLQMKAPDALSFEVLRDLAAGVLAQLAATRVVALGLNTELFYSFENAELWHRIGDNLAPKQYWTPPLIEPGVHGLWIRSKRKDDTPGHCLIHLRPDPLFTTPSGPFGIAIEVNDHYVIDPPTAASAASEIQERWDETFQDAQSICDHVLKSAAKDEPQFNVARAPQQ